MSRLSPCLLLAVIACSSRTDAPTGEWSGTTSQLGDTTVVTTARESQHPRRKLDSVTVLWRSDSLDRPTHLVLVGDSLLAIADRTRIFLVSADGTLRATLGRQGEGPGEFVQLGAIGVDRDAIIGIDRRTRHWNAFNTDGSLRASGLIAPAPALVNPMPGRLAVRDSAVLLGWYTLGLGSNPMVAGIASHPLDGSEATVVDRMTGQAMVLGPLGSASYAALFGPNPRHAVAPNGRSAFGDGVDYCLSVSGASRPMRICREWNRVPVTEAVRHPDYDAIAAASGQDIETFALLRDVLQQVTVGDTRNSYTGLHFDSDSRLWVQVVDSLSANVHPILGRYLPDQAPPYRHYDVIGDDGRLLHELLLPTPFTPWDAAGNMIYGLYETPEGDLAVALARM